MAKSKLGRPSNKGINAFMADWLIDHKYETVNEAAVAKVIRQSTLESLCDMSTTHKIFSQILELAEKMDLEPGELMRGVLEGKSREPVPRQEIARRIGKELAS